MERLYAKGEEWAKDRNQRSGVRDQGSEIRDQGKTGLRMSAYTLTLQLLLQADKRRDFAGLQAG
jgi:hypothetical protein